MTERDYGTDIIGGKKRGQGRKGVRLLFKRLKNNVSTKMAS